MIREHLDAHFLGRLKQERNEEMRTVADLISKSEEYLREFMHMLLFEYGLEYDYLSDVCREVLYKQWDEDAKDQE